MTGARSNGAGASKAKVAIEGEMVAFAKPKVKKALPNLWSSLEEGKDASKKPE